MGKKAPSAPAAPDPVAMANAQSAANRDAILAAAEMNRINQYTPYGNLVYRQSPQGQWATYTELPQATLNTIKAQQNIGADLAQLAQQRARQINQTMPDYSGLPNLQYQVNTSPMSALPQPDDFNRQASQLTQAHYQQASQLMAPDFARQRQALEQQLANQGLPMGSVAWADAMNRMDTQQNQALNQAAFAAMTAGRAEQQRLYDNAVRSRGQQYNESLSALNLNNAMRQQAYNERLNQYNQPVQQLAALMGQTQAVPTPNFNGGTWQAPTLPIDTMSATMQGYQGQMNNYNNQMARYMTDRQAMGGLGSMLFGGLF